MFLFLDTSDFHSIFAALLDERGNVVKKRRLKQRRGKRASLLALIDGLLRSVKKSPKDIRGILAVEGPGAFSALRVGISAANAFGAVAGIPLAPVPQAASYDFRTLIQKVRWQTVGKVIVPRYGKEPNITKPKKKREPTQD